jgi:riboflavin kinase / FMN adenylyltransferase
MKIHQGYENLKILNPVVTLGIFDGVHAGHKALIAAVTEKAKILHGESVIITFYPHPRSVLSSENTAMTLLTTMEEKISLLENENVDHLIVVPFDHDLSNKEACHFIEEVLVKKLGTRCLVAGFNHHFGKKGEGDFEIIRRCAGSFGIIVLQESALTSNNHIISSSIIRQALNSGDLETANRLLGYDFFLNGVVSSGKQLGRTIGFPTANIVPDSDNKLIPLGGVYAVDVFVEGSQFQGMLNIGTNPTVNSDSGKKTIEVNIFDFDRDIYNSKIRVVFRYRLRDEKKFGDISLLVSQLELDKKNAGRLLNR